MTLEALKEVIAELAEDERHSLAVWLNQLDYDAWDREMLRDFSPGGRGAHMLEKVKADITSGKFRPIEQLCAERKQQRQ